MNTINATKTSNFSDNIMPMPLDMLKQVVNGGYDEQTDKLYMKFLQSNLYTTLKPYVDQALADEQYVGSPIYNGYIDRDTIGTIVDKAIYYAEQNVPDINKIVENVDTSNYSKSALLRTIVQTMVVDEVFFNLRPANKDAIYYDNTLSDQMINIEENNMINMDNLMPSPIETEQMAQ